MHSSHKVNKIARKRPLKSQWEKPTNHTGKPSHRKNVRDKRDQHQEDVYA